MLSLIAASLLCADPAPVASTGASPDAEPGPVVTTWAAPRRVPPPGSAAEGVPDLAFLPTSIDPEGDMPREVAFTPDGTAAVIVNRDTDNLTFFDVATRTITHTVDVGDFPVHVAVTPDGRYALAPNVFSNTVSVVDVATHTVAAHVPVTGDQPFRVAVSSDATFAVVAVINDGVASSFSVIDLGSLTESHSFPTSGQGVFGFFFTPESGISGNLYTQFALAPDDATIVLPDSGGGFVRLYDVATGTEEAALAVSAGPRAVDISADGTLAVVTHEASPAGITEIDLAAQSVLDFNGVGSQLVSQVVRITPDKSHAIAAISNNVIFVDLATGATTATLSTGSVGDIEISFDGQYAFVSNFNARIIDIASRAIVRTMTFAACVESATSPVEHRAVALNNRFREDIHLYDIDGAAGFFEGFALSGEPPEGDATRSLAISPDGTTVVAGNNTSRNASIIDIASGTVRATVDTGDRPLGVRVSPDGSTAVVCNGDEDTISVIDLATDTNVADVPIFSRPVDVRISPDSGTAYVTSVSGADRLHFVDLAGPASAVTGSLLTGQMGSIIYTYNVTSGIELSPDGSVLALCYSFDDELGIVDTATQTELVRVPVGDFPIRVAFSPDGSAAYVVNSFSDDLYVVDVAGAGSTVAAVVPGIDFPLTIDVDDTAEFVYAGSFGVGGMAVVSTASNSIVTGVVLGSAPRAAHLAGDTLHVVTTGGELIRLDAAGPATAVIDATPLSSGPSDMVFSEPRNTAVAAQPIPDGVDLVLVAPLGDLDRDGVVGILDFLILLGAWGPCPDPPDSCPADLDGDGVVGILDFLILLGNWG